MTKGLVVFAAALSLMTVAACGGDDNEDVLRPADGVDQIVRQVLQEGEPASASGQLLQLTRVIIPGGMEIAPHTHPGMQQAIVVEGTLMYTVIEGEAQLTRDAGTADAVSETITAGTTVELTPGSSVLEVPGMVHMAHNAGGKSVVIYLSSLFPVGAPASSPAP
jgi:quercetin dioxygenase-like cupin family protein